MVAVLVLLNVVTVDGMLASTSRKAVSAAVAKHRHFLPVKKSALSNNCRASNNAVLLARRHFFGFGKSEEELLAEDIQKTHSWTDGRQFHFITNFEIRY